MRSLRSLLFFSDRRTGRWPLPRKKPGRVPFRAYPLWRRTTVQLSVATIILAAGGSWLWLEGDLESVPAHIQAWKHQKIVNLGFTVEQITVSGRGRTSTEDILAALGMSQGQSLLDLDTEAAKQKVEALGWIKTASVSRYFPDAIHVELTERRPFALWQLDGKLSVIDRDGTVITTDDLGRFSKLPVVVGPGARFAAAALIDILVTEPVLYKQVEAAARVGKRRWNLHLSSGVEVQLPASDLSDAWQRLAALEQDYGILSRDIDAIDLRLPDRLAVRLTKPAAQRVRDPGKEA